MVTPSPFPDPKDDQGWSFPDNKDRILSAIRQGATHLWVNTILFSAHPLQTSLRLEEYKNKVWVVGQPPLLVEKFDDKEYTNTVTCFTPAVLLLCLLEGQGEVFGSSVAG
jgi:hypothetical protein